MVDENPPERSWIRGPFIIPTKVTPTVLAKGETPSVSKKPGVLYCCVTHCDCAQAGRESVKVTAHTSGVGEGMDFVPEDVDGLIRIGDNGLAEHAPVRLRSITASTHRHLSHKAS